jgi:transcriptional repressor NrdR
MEKVVDVVEALIYNSLEREIPSAFIGELVMDKLRELDEVAYVRFASVYRQFKDINTLMFELNKLLQDRTIK